MKSQLFFHNTISGSILLCALFFVISNTNCNELLDIVSIGFKCEYKVTPLRIDNADQRLSWKSIQIYRVKGENQTVDRILLASSLENVDRHTSDVWNFRKVKTDQSANTFYHGISLVAEKQYFWKVKVRNKTDNVFNGNNYGKCSVGLPKLSDRILKLDQEKTDYNW